MSSILNLENTETWVPRVLVTGQQLHIKALFTRHKLTQVVFTRHFAKPTRVEPGRTRVSSVYTTETNPGRTRVRLCRVYRA